MSKNEFLTEYNQDLDYFCKQASYMWKTLKTSNTKLKKSDIVSIEFNNLEEGEFPGLFRNTDYPSIEVIINTKTINDTTFQYKFLILCYPNCCGIAILYGIEYVYEGKEYNRHQNTTAVLFLLKEICSLLGYGSCQYVCTSYQDSVIASLEKLDFKKVHESSPRINYEKIYEDDDDYDSEFEWEECEETDKRIYTYQLNLNN